MADEPVCDLITRAKQYLNVFDEEPDRYAGARGIIRQLITALEKADAEAERLRKLYYNTAQFGGSDV